MKRWIALLGILIATVVYASPLPLGGSGTFFEVTHFPSFQAAINAIPSGGTLHVPAGTYTCLTTPAVTAMRITNKTVNIIGDGIASTYIKYCERDSDLLTLSNSEFSVISGIRFEGAGVGGTGRAVVLDRASYGRIEDCWFDAFPSWTIDMSATTGDLVANCFTRVRSSRNFRGGCFKLGDNTTHRAFSTRFFQCLTVTDSMVVNYDISWANKVVIRDCGLEAKSDTCMIYSNGLTITPIIDGCWFEQTAATSNNWMILAKAGTNPNWSISNNYFVRTDTTRRAIRAFKSEGGTKGLVVLNTFGQTGSATAPNGTDDIVTAAGDDAIVEGGQVWNTASTIKGQLRLSTGDSAPIQKFGIAKLFKPFVTTAADTANFTDVVDGSVFFNATSGRLMVFSNSIWRNCNLIP